MITTQTFEFSKTAKDEMLVISAALALIKDRRYDEATRVLIARHDELTRNPTTKPYDQRNS